MLTTRCVLAAMVLAAPAADAEETDRFHGDDTSLQRALREVRRAELAEADIWTFESTAIIVLQFPRRTGLRTEDLRRSGIAGVAWRPMWISPYTLRLDASEASLAVIRRARMVLVFRTENLGICAVNEITGRRVFEENAKQQDASATEGPCSALPETLERLGVPLPWNTEINRFILARPGSVEGGKDAGADVTASPPREGSAQPPAPARDASSR